MSYMNGNKVLNVEFIGGTGITDQEYDPSSANAQSGKAVSQAMSSFSETQQSLINISNEHEFKLEQLEQREYDEVLYDDFGKKETISDFEITIPLGKEVTHLKIFAVLRFAEGTTGGREFYCNGICDDNSTHLIAYRSNVAGNGTDNLMEKLTFSAEWQWYDIPNSDGSFGMSWSCDFSVFAGGASNNNNRFSSATSKETTCSKPTKIKFKVPNCSIGTNSYILIKGY